MKKVFAVFDVKAASYGNPVFLPTAGIALRTFADICADPKSPLCQHPADYSLYELGEFDPNSGKLTSLPEPKFLYSAADVVQSLISSRLPVEVKSPKVEVSA